MQWREIVEVVENITAEKQTVESISYVFSYHPSLLFFIPPVFSALLSSAFSIRHLPSNLLSFLSSSSTSSFTSWSHISKMWANASRKQIRKPPHTYSGVSEGWNVKGSRKCHCSRGNTTRPLKFLLCTSQSSFLFSNTAHLLLCFTSEFQALIQFCLVVLKFSLFLLPLMATDSALLSSLIQTDRPCFFSCFTISEQQAAELCHWVHRNTQHGRH